MTAASGIVHGIVELLAQPESEEPPMCDRCDGELKNAPVLGFPLLSGLTKNGDKGLAEPPSNQEAASNTAPSYR